MAKIDYLSQLKELAKVKKPRFFRGSIEISSDEILDGEKIRINTFKDGEKDEVRTQWSSDVKNIIFKMAEDGYSVTTFVG